jgi:hypothetical protein
MNVSPVSAVSPSQIDWRKLTAKEIIKYENQGVQVPDEYLQWAKTFINNISASDNDETTYEMALSSNENSQTTMSAAQRREQMEEEGYGLETIATTFEDESKTKAQDCTDTSSTLSDIGTTSDNLVSTLDSSLNDIFSKADSIKSEIEALKTQKNKNNLAKINELKQQLKGLGITGQSVLLGVDTDLNEYQTVIAEYSGKGPDAVNYGQETKKLGTELQKIALFDYLKVGKRVEDVGKDTIQKGDSFKDVYLETAERNRQNIINVNQLNIELKSKTGVAGLDGSSSTEDEKTSTEDEKDKENKQQEADRIGSASIDSILQYKIKKGEDIKA